MDHFWEHHIGTPYTFQNLEARLNLDRNATVSFPCLTRRIAVKLFLFSERTANRVSPPSTSKYSCAIKTCPRQALRFRSVDFFYKSFRPRYYSQHREEHPWVSRTIELILEEFIESTFTTETISLRYHRTGISSLRSAYSTIFNELNL